MSPKARSMAYLREAGFCVTDVEKWGSSGCVWLC